MFNMNKRGEAVTVLVVIGLLALGAYTLLTVSSNSPTGLTGFQTGAITACGNVAASDSLTQDISSTDSCLNITASNVVLDCAGFTVNFNGGSGAGDIGIHARNVNNITIKNCNINDTSAGGDAVFGILLENVSNSLVENSNFTIRGTLDDRGLRISGDYTFGGVSSSDNNIVRNNRFLMNGTFYPGGAIQITSNITNNTVENNYIFARNSTSLGTCCSRSIYFEGAGANNIIKNNIIDSHTSIGIFVSSISNSLVENNIINYAGTSNLSGLALNTLSSVQVKNNTVNVTRAGTSENPFGVTFGLNTDTIVEYNSVIVDAGSSARGFSTSGDNFNSSIRHNLITTNGTGGLNLGFHFNGAGNLTIFNNTINTSGNSGSNHGIALFSISSNNNISNNTITTSSAIGSGSNRGISLESGISNLINGNHISTSGSSGSNYGIYLTDVSDVNNITNNNITTSGSLAGGNRGIYLEFKADYNIISGNVINTTGNGGNNNGIELFARNVTSGGGPPPPAGSIDSFGVQSPNPTICAGGAAQCESVSNNWVYRNIIRSNGTDQSHGIVLRSENFEAGGGGGGASIGGFGTSAALNSNNFSVSGNLVEENTVLKSSYNNIVASDCINLNGINPANSAVNNSFRNNNVSNCDGAGANFIAASSGTQFNGTRIINPGGWLNASVSTSHEFINTTFATDFGSIKINGTFTFVGIDSILRTNLNITFNRAFLNSTAEPDLNQSARITLENIPFLIPQALVDFDDDGVFDPCNSPQCVFVSFNGSTFIYDVLSFTSYSSSDVGGVNITLTKDDSPDPINLSATTLLNYTITINVTDGDAFNITLQDIYPPNTTFVSSSPAPTSGNNIWNVGNLTANQSFQVNITVNVSNLLANGTILNNIANITFENSTGSVITLNVTEQTTVINEVVQNLTPTVVVVTKTDSPDPVNNGSQLTYQINVTVTQGNATNVTVVDAFPSGVSFNTSQPTNTSSGTWVLGNLTTNQSVLINITVNVNSNASGTLVNNVNVTFQNATNDTNSVAASASTTVNTGGGGGGSGGGGGGSGGSGGVICPPLCQYPENRNLPVCRNNCPAPTEMVPPVAQFPSFGSDVTDSSSGIKKAEPIIDEKSEETVEVAEETPAERSGFAKFFPWLVLLVLIALLIAVLSRNRDDKNSPVVKVVPPKAEKPNFKASSRETQKILDDIRKSEERLRKLLGK